MAISKSALAALSFAALLAAGCQSERMQTFDTRTPEPLTPAPTGTVTAGALPPPGAPGATDPNAFPAAPGATTTTAALPPAGGPPAGAADVSATAVAGVWNASVSGQSCKVATPQTKFGSGFRAGPLRCPAPLDGVKSWNVAGKQLTLYDESGGTLARLYSSSPERFDGQTETGLPVSLSR
ncbi:MAG TPA: protease inhibitor Inh/omp19 family protein [Rhizobiaceae bacterium]|nr:protease inhibitor Inh/omp19 family protein [Rhizobiaceae bacterium]